MKITVRLFAILKERLGTDRQELEVDDPVTPPAILEAMARARPGVARLVPQCRVAVNRSFAAPDRVIAPTDEVALVPPIAGG